MIDNKYVIAFFLLFLILAIFFGFHLLNYFNQQQEIIVSSNGDSNTNTGSDSTTVTSSDSSTSVGSSGSGTDSNGGTSANGNNNGNGDNSYLIDSSEIKGVRLGVLPDPLDSSSLDAYIYMVFSDENKNEFYSYNVNMEGITADVEIWSTKTIEVWTDPVTKESQTTIWKKLGEKHFDKVPNCISSLSQDKNCHLYISEDDFDKATLEEDRYGYVVVLLKLPHQQDFFIDLESGMEISDEELFEELIWDMAAIRVRD